MATYSVYNEDGTPAGQQSCTKGDRCYPPLQPGQYKVALDTDTTQAVPTGMAAPLRVTSIDADGKLVHPDRAAMPAGANPATMVPTTSLDVANVAIPAKEEAAAAPIAAQPPPQGYAAPATSSGPQYSDPYAAFANVPNYRNGQRHPAAGGLPLTAGGPFAAMDDGYDNRQQMYVPGGAAAGPFETRSAPTPSGANTGGYGGGQAWNDQGRQAGGGGGTHPLYDKLRAKGEEMAAKVRGMAQGVGGGGSSGGYSGDSGSTSTQQYRRQGRRMDRASERYYDEVNNPDPQQARGWAKQNLGKNRGNYGIYLTDPMRLIGDADLVDPSARNTLDFLRGEPAAELAMIMGGTGRRDMTRKVKPVRVPKVLKGSIDPLKPEFKRELDYSKYTKQLADIYADLQGGGQSANFDTLMGKLANAKRSGALMQGIDMQAASGDVGGALDRAKGYFDAVFATSQPEPLQGVYSRMAEERLAELNLGRKKPKAISKAVKQIAQEFT